MEDVVKGEWWRYRLNDSENAHTLNETTREFWAELKAEIPQVAYLSIKGSTIKGYAGHGSDIDAYVVFDRSNDPDNKIKMRICDFVKKFEKKSDTKFHIFMDNLDNLADPYMNYHHAKDLISPTLGEGDRYREVIRNSLGELSKEDLRKWVDYVVDGAMYEHSPVKAIERGLIRPEEEQEYLDVRKRLIRARVENYFVNTSD